MREKYLEELVISMAIGTLITAFILSMIHKVFTPGEFMAAYIATSMICTYAVWSVIVWIERRRNVDIEVDD